MGPDAPGTLYGPVILEHYRRPRNRGPLDAADAIGEADNPLCGDRVRIGLRMGPDGRIADARFQAEACAICTAAASLITEMVRAVPPHEATAIDDAQILRALEVAIRPARLRCATLPLDALRAAVGALTRRGTQ